MVNEMKHIIVLTEEDMMRLNFGLEVDIDLKEPGPASIMSEGRYLREYAGRENDD